MCMQRTLHVHAKYFALQQYKTKKRRAERNAPRGAVCIPVFLNYLLEVQLRTPKERGREYPSMPLPYRLSY